MTIRLTKYVDIEAGVRGTDALPWIPPVFDPGFAYVLYLESGGVLLLETGQPILSENSGNG